MNQDPYKPPSTIDLPAGIGVRSWRQRLEWIGIFAVNLPLPLYFGLGATSANSTSAMFATIVLVLLAGVLLCQAFPGLARTVTIGGIFTALSQFVPVLHIIGGLIGFAIADTLHLRDDNSGIGHLGPMDVTAAFVVTLTAASVLLCAAAVVGICVQFTLNYFRQRKRGEVSSPAIK